MGLYEFRFPELGEGLHEGRIEKWLIKPGDEVKEDDAIAEVENDKAMVELPSPVDGRVIELKVPDGSTVVVGDLIILFEVAGEGNSDATVLADEKASAVQQAGLESVAQRVETASPVSQPVQGSTSTPVPSFTQEILATPGVRKFAREQGVDIAQVRGTGAHGKVTREDVINFLQGQSTLENHGVQTVEAPRETEKPVAKVDTQEMAVTTTVTTGASGNLTTLEERVPLPSIRKIIAQAMAKSKYTAPHVTIMDEADVTELVKFRQEIKPLAVEREIKMTYLPFIVKALVATVKKFPQLNASFDEEKQELVLKRSYHIGIATDTDRGLLVPVIGDADRKNMWMIAQAIDDLAGRARSGKLMPNEMKGSTISITNIGSAGGMFFTPIINYPEVAILGVGRITERPVMKNGEVVGAQMMALSLSFDHRIIDGALAQHAMNELKNLLANPRLLLLEV
ncbi:dihydrolipoamide acetyltransferase family protein [Sulfoacidibacillus thermotolerans]|uniref:Dihydrolipoamide acetyltransferase component of pyruvate dehydrogenase complex n=1 Tax=Sulfoacidibacillus thermotolerans TaxID=1765684 RepID=A0A2U3DB39_SULT2|nr:dihydrolipoamide acetyltransferase family protein [Sulfoacidibacillus thermotolerans]PWI58493.1 dienelactone hydrolase [Sulfoacidibacillus thermotolerans]